MSKLRRRPKAPPTKPWWRRLQTWLLALLASAVTAGVTAAVVGFVNRTVPPAPEPLPTPGSGFEPAVDVIPKSCQKYALARTIDPDTEAAELPTVDTDDAGDFDKFITGQQGAPIGTITIQVVLTGIRVRPTRILDMRVARLRTTDNLAGTELSMSCGGDPETRTVTLDLDKPPRSLMKDGKPFFEDRGLDVSAEERETVRVSVAAAQHSYRWIFAIDHIDDSGHRVTNFLDARGRLYADTAKIPEDAEFSLTGTANTYGVRYQESGGRFTLASG